MINSTLQAGVASAVAIMAAMMACRPVPTSTTAAQRLGAACDPATYGAVPDDDVVDREAFQRALDVSGSLCVGPGRWRMARAPVGSRNRFAALSVHGQHATVSGAGQDSTVLELAGDQGGGAVTVLSVDAGAGDVTIQDLAIDMAGVTNGDEQSHAIATSAVGGSGPISGLTIRRVAFAHPRPSDGSRGGDCIRLLGNDAGTEVSDVVVSDVTRADCGARAFVELQRGLRRVTIQDNHVQRCGDSCVDSEPTGVGVDEDVTIVRNVFDCSEGAQGDSDVSLGGASAETPMRRVTMTGNKLCRGLNTYRVAGVEVSDNTIGGAMRGEGGVVEISNACSETRVARNWIGRSGKPGPVLRATPHSGVLCSGLTVEDNSVVQSTGGSGVWAESVSNLSVRNNMIQWTSPAPSAYGVYVRATVAPVTEVQVVGNTMLGQVGWAVCLSASPFPFTGGVVVTGNSSSAGAQCVGSGGFAPMVVEGLSPRRCPS